MDDIQKSIYKNLKSGEYYNDALDWYSFNYVYPASQRIFVALLFCLVLTMVSIVYTLYNTSVNNIENYFYSTYVNDETKQKVSLLTVDHPVSEQLAIAEFLIKKYVSKYETYDVPNLSKQVEFLKRNSSSTVMKEFYKDMQPAISGSRASNYKSSTLILPSDIKINFRVDQNKGSEEADVSLKLNVTDLTSLKTNVVNKKLFIRFKLTDIKDIIDYQKPLIFQVIEYRIVDK